MLCACAIGSYAMSCIAVNVILVVFSWRKNKNKKIRKKKKKIKKKIIKKKEKKIEKKEKEKKVNAASIYRASDKPG